MNQEPLPSNEPEMGGNDMMGDEPNDMPNEFDTNFDAGVDADENADPKKFIQQLTGKLSQTLRTYNQNQNDPDLNKYVAGMIAAQAAENLDENDKDEIINKIQNASSNDNPDMGDNMNQNDMGSQDMDMNNPNDNGLPPMDNQNDNMPSDDDNLPPMENVRKKKPSIKEGVETLDEILNDILQTDDEPKQMNYNNKPNRNSYKVKPFVNPLMK